MRPNNSSSSLAQSKNTVPFTLMPRQGVQSYIGIPQSREFENGPGIKQTPIKNNLVKVFPKHISYHFHKFPRVSTFASGIRGGISDFQDYHFPAMAIAPPPFSHNST